MSGRSIFSYWLDGMNISEAQAFSRDGDIRRLGDIMRNNIIINQIETTRMEREQREAQFAQERYFADLQDSGFSERAYQEQRRQERIAALDATIRRREGKVPRVSDEGVDDFLKF